jgi:putative FmdB family regulatory protein
MPIYEYQPIVESNCGYCATGFDLLQKLAETPLTTCPKCKCAVRRIISAPHLTKADVSLERSNLEKHGFTRYQKAEKGVYEKTAGNGPDLLDER